MPAKTKLTPAEAEARVLLSMREDVVPRVQALRRLVMAALPEAEERAHPGWSNFNYYVEGELGYVAAQEETVMLGLTRGNELSDPDGLLIAKKGSRFMRQSGWRPAQSCLKTQSWRSCSKRPR